MSATHRLKGHYYLKTPFGNWYNIVRGENGLWVLRQWFNGADCIGSCHGDTRIYPTYRAVFSTKRAALQRALYIG